MKIKRLTLENFGIYAGGNTLDFHGDKPVVLIGGMNGRGKTTILEAVLLALYGRRSFAVEESRLAFPRYLANWVNKADGRKETRIELEFEIPSKDENMVYTAIREWSLRTATPSLKTKVLKNGVCDHVLSENWDLFVEEMLPSAIAPFFFFDGEKISELASADNNEQMKESIKTLLGINVIDQAVSDVERILSDKKTLIKSASFEKELAEYKSSLEEVDAKIRESEEQNDVLLAKSTELNNKLQDAEKMFDSMGGTLALNRKDLSAKKAVLQERLARAAAQVHNVAAGDLPLLMTLPLLHKALTVSNREVEQRSIRAVLEQLPALFHAYSKGKKTELKFDDFINYVKSTATDEAPIYALTEGGQYHLQRLCDSLPSEQRKAAVSALAEQELIQRELTEVENYLSLNVDDTEARKQHKEILTLTADLATVREQLRVAQTAKDVLLSSREEISRKHNKLVEKAVSNIEGEEDNKRIIKYSGLTVKVLQEYKIRLQAAKTKNLAETMTDCFTRLASKKSLIREIQIDEVSLGFRYLNGNGSEVSHSSFSAGEKQLLVIAMLWALGICSKKQLPIIIDTPLARMDSVHRKSLITNYFPCASEQTILLSTDSEVHGHYYDMLKPFVDKEYTLVYDDNTKQTTIEKGYFGGGAR